MSEFSIELFHHLLIKDTNQSLLQIHEQYQLFNRGILLNWISEICEIYNISFKTTELAIKYVDHGLSALDIGGQRLELLGLTSIYMATKLNETFDYKVQEQMQQSNIPLDDIIQLEMELIRSLQWNLFLLTPSDFMDHVELQDSHQQIQMVIQYILISENFTSLNNFETFSLAYYQCMNRLPANYEIFYNDQLRQKIIQNQLILDQSLRQPDETQREFDQMLEANTEPQSPESRSFNSNQDFEQIEIAVSQLSILEPRNQDISMALEQEVEINHLDDQFQSPQTSLSSEDSQSDSDRIPLFRVRRKIRKQKELPSTSRK